MDIIAYFVDIIAQYVDIIAYFVDIIAQYVDIIAYFVDIIPLPQLLACLVGEVDSIDS